MLPERAARLLGVSKFLRGVSVPSLPGYVWLLLILLVTGALYLPMLSHWFLTDDYLFIHAFRQESMFSYVTDAFDVRNAPPSPELRFYRPLHSTVFLLLHKGLHLEPAGYHAWSLAVHLLNVALLWLVALRLTKRPLVAGIAAILFGVHPAYAPAVAWISNNNALMATSWSLIAFWSFLKADQDKPSQPWWYGASLIAYTTSLLFHPETGVLLPVLVAYRLANSQDRRDFVRWRFWAFLAPYTLVALGYFSIHFWMVNKDFLPQSENFYVSMQIVRTYLSYFSTSVYPVPLDQVALDSARLSFVASSLILAMVLLVWSGRRRPYLSAFAVLWFLLSLFPLTTADAFNIEAQGRKLYSAGPALAFMIAIFAVLAIDLVPSRLRSAARAGVLFAVCLAVAFSGWLTIDRQDKQGELASNTEHFIGQLREQHPVIEPGSTLYVIGPFPPGIPIFASYLPPLVGLYYEDIEVIRGDAPEILPDGDVVFAYDPDG